MPRMISILTGSFKPPHRGHFYLLKTMLDKTKKPRKGDIGPGYVYIFISNKPRDPCQKITGEISKEIWESYISLLPIKDQVRVKLILSKMPSPVLTAYGFAKRIASPGDTFYLVKSAKNAQNTRYSSFKNLGDQRIQFKEMVLPGFADLHSTDMRKAIAKGDKRKFYFYLPNKMKPLEKKKLWDKLEKLCKK